MRWKIDQAKMFNMYFEYFRDKIFKVAKIPKERFGQ